MTYTLYPTAMIAVSRCCALANLEAESIAMADGGFTIAATPNLSTTPKSNVVENDCGCIDVPPVSGRSREQSLDEIRDLMFQHNITYPAPHDNLNPEYCVCWTQPNLNSARCYNCGGQVIPNGSCWLCAECGSSNGCSG